MPSEHRSTEHEYGIGAVAKLTGLTDHTIRAWERRYGAVVAQRSANGRRVYGPNDVEKLGLLKSLTDQGVGIGQIAGDSIAELRERAHALDMLISAPVPDRVGVAVLGEFLPGQLAARSGELAPLDIRISDSNRERFAADLRRHDVDVVVVESPILDDRVINEMRTHLRHADAARGVLIYSFGRTNDVNTARNSHIVTLRAPVSMDEVREAALRAFTPQTSFTANAGRSPKTASTEPESTAEKIEPRRFTSQQLATLIQASTAIDCECPHHLAQLVGDLNAFEVYSARCENRDEKDAELHRYLHQTTARARSLIEVALERVAREEGIDY